MSETKTWIIYDRNTGKIQRVVECAEEMVMMSGMWSSQWDYACWETILQRAKDTRDRLALPNQSGSEGE